MEIWKVIDGFNGKFSVSTLGRIRNNKTQKIRKVHKDKYGYAKITVRQGKGSRIIYIHRAVCLSFLERIKSKNIVNHLNGVRDDNRLENLEWCTQKENVRHGMNSRPNPLLPINGIVGTACIHAKLTEDQVIEIRGRMNKRGEYKLICAEFGICSSTAFNIKNRKKWKHLK